MKKLIKLILENIKTDKTMYRFCVELYHKGIIKGWTCYDTNEGKEYKIIFNDIKNWRK